MGATMDIMDKVLERTKRFEGFSSKPYQCSAGEWTIGYGHLIKNGLSRAAAELILQEDLKTATKAANAYTWFSKLNPARQAVVIDMLYNIGPARFAGFKKMRAAIERGDFETATKEMLDSKYAKQVVKRAAENARMLKTGEW